MQYFNRWFLTAAVMMAATAAIHAFGGGPEINAPIQASSLAPMLRGISAVIWHALTALFVIFAAGLTWASWRKSDALVWMILAVCLAFVGLFMGIGLVLLGNVTVMPQWVIFLSISGVLLAGLFRSGHRPEARG